MYNETVKTPSKSNGNTNLTEVFHVKPPRLAFSFFTILSIKYSFLWELKTLKRKFKIANILKFVHAWENKLQISFH